MDKYIQEMDASGKGEIDEISNTNKQISQRLSDLKSNSLILLERKQYISEIIARLQGNKSTLESKLNAIKDKTKQSEVFSKENKNSLKNIEKQIAESKAELESITRELDNFKSQDFDIGIQLNILRSNVDMINEKLKIHSQFRNKNYRDEWINHRIETKRSELSELGHESENISKQIQEINQKHKSLQNEIESFVEIIRNENIAIENFQKTISDLNSKKVEKVDNKMYSFFLIYLLFHSSFNKSY